MIDQGFVRTVAPASEPVTLTEAKAHCNVTISTDDTLITSLITAAREQVEHDTGLALMPQTWTLTADAFPDNDERILLFPAPLYSVTSVVYKDGSNVSTTMSASDYKVLTHTKPGQVALAYGETWPSTYDEPGVVVVTFVAGYGNAGLVPELAKAAIKLLVADLYEHREAQIDRAALGENMAYQRIIDLLKVAWYR